MFDEIREVLTQIIETNGWLAPLAAFAGGTLTAANPCVIAAIPLMMAYVAGGDTHRSGFRSFVLSLTFSLGLTAMFGLMFLATWAASSFLRAEWWLYIASAVCLLMGLHLLGVLDIKIPAPSGVTPSQRGLVGAFVLGLLFGLISLPCAGPILLVVLSLVPVKGPVFGGMLLVAYSLGHCVLILIGGTSMGLVQKLIGLRGWQRANVWCKRVAGLAAIGVGLFLLAS